MPGGEISMLSAHTFGEMRTKIDANGTLVDFVAHDEDMCVGSRRGSGDGEDGGEVV